MNSTHNTRLTRGIALMGFVKISSLLKMSFVFGTCFTWFSASSVMTPLLGSFGGSLSAILFFALSLLGRFAFGYSFSAKIAAFYLPGLCASLYMAQRSALYAVVIPLLCTVAFIAHPAGISLYSVYWLIPVVLFLMPKQTFFTLALTTTFVAHAVGATIWIYTQPTTQSFWLNLMPIIALERLIYALGMVVVHKAVTALFNKKYSLRTYFLRRA